MKKFVFTFIIAFFSLLAQGKNEVPVTPDPPAPETGNRKKSRPIYPVISFEGVNFTVSTSLPTNEVQFSVIAALSDISYIPVITCFVLFLINDIYTFINWTRMHKRQEISQTV